MPAYLVEEEFDYLCSQKSALESESSESSPLSVVRPSTDVSEVFETVLGVGCWECELSAIVLNDNT